MVSPVFGVMVEAVLLGIFWARFVDDTFIIIQSALNCVFPEIQFALQEEKAQKEKFTNATQKTKYLPGHACG